jgi:hypothetical protein
MISDDDGDLPLHFACCNGAPASLLRVMTTASSGGDPASATVRNSKNRLAVDDYIEWYADGMNDGRGMGRGETEETSEGGDEDVDDGEYEDRSDDVGDSDSGSDSDSDDGIESFSVPSNRALVHFSWILPRDVMEILSATCEEHDLRAAMWVLIHAAATAVRNSALHIEERIHDEGNELMPKGSLLPAAVIATKYSNFPALALAACIIWRRIDNDDDDVGDNLLEEDSYGYLPLHWACGDIYLLLASGPISSEASLDRRTCHTSCTTMSHNPSNVQCGALARFNTAYIPCSIIEFLLECKPDTARTPTRDGRLPLHLLVADGNLSDDVRTPSNEVINGGGDYYISDRQPWDDIKLLLKEYPEALGTPDGKSNLYPFQVAATSSTGQIHGLASLENTYRLIMEDPSLLCQLLESNTKNSRIE